MEFRGSLFKGPIGPGCGPRGFLLRANLSGRNLTAIATSPPSHFLNLGLKKNLFCDASFA